MNRYDYFDTDSYTDNFESCMNGGVHKVKPSKNPYYNIKHIKPNKKFKIKFQENGYGRKYHYRQKGGRRR